MSKPSVRELGHMTIANDVITVTETAAGMIQPHPEFWEAITDLNYPSGLKGLRILSEWIARSDDQTLAIGWLLRIQEDSCAAFLAVAPDHRRLGIGRFMAKFVTDLAIRYRQRTIYATIQDNNEAGQILAEAESFDHDKDSTVWEKKLNWI